jgi:hypothetical protein
MPAIIKYFLNAKKRERKNAKMREREKKKKEKIRNLNFASFRVPPFAFFRV